MRTGTWVMLAAAALCVAVVTPALAQFDSGEESRFGIRAGLFAPLSSELRDIKSTWFGLGVDYALKRDEAGKALRCISAEFYDTGDDDVKAGTNPITYNVIKRSKESEKGSNYLSAGLGVSKLRLRGYFPAPDAGYVRIDESGWVPCGCISVGREIRSSYIIQLSGYVLPNWQGRNWSGISLTVGTRVAF